MQLYGAVATETFGHLNFAFGDRVDAEELFRDVLMDDPAQRIGPEAGGLSHSPFGERVARPLC